MRVYVKFLCCFAIVAKCFAEDLPSFIHVCHRDDPNIEQCMMAAVEDLRPYLVKGVPEYNIPSIEPLVMHDLISENVAGMHIVTSNVSAYGCSDFFVRNISMNMETHKVSLDVYLPRLRIQAHYIVDGRLLLVPVKGNGDLEANVTECNAHCSLEGELYEKEGDTYLKYNSIDLDVTVGGGTARLENLFNGDKVLLGIINDVVNKNFDVFMKELMPVVQKALSSTFLDIGNKIVENFTYKQLFPH